MQHERREERIDGRAGGQVPPVEQVAGLRGLEALDTDAPQGVEPPAAEGPPAAPRPTQLNPLP